MAEYIEREAATQAAVGYFWNTQVVLIGTAGIAKAINAIPAADVVPVVHGRWVDYMVRDFHCSMCKEKLAGHGWEGYYINDLPNYCPNCGCRMDGGNE